MMVAHLGMKFSYRALSSEATTTASPPSPTPKLTVKQARSKEVLVWGWGVCYTMDSDTGQVEDPGHGPQTLEDQDKGQRSLSEKALRPQASLSWL